MQPSCSTTCCSIASRSHRRSYNKQRHLKKYWAAPQTRLHSFVLYSKANKTANESQKRSMTLTSNDNQNKRVAYGFPFQWCILQPVPKSSERREPFPYTRSFYLHEILNGNHMTRTCNKCKAFSYVQRRPAINCCQTCHPCAGVEAFTSKQAPRVPSSRRTA